MKDNFAVEVESNMIDHKELAKDIVQLFTDILNDERISEVVRDEISDRIEKVVLKYARA